MKPVRYKKLKRLHAAWILHECMHACCMANYHDEQCHTLCLEELLVVSLHAVFQQHRSCDTAC